MEELAKTIGHYCDKVWGWVDGQVGGWRTYTRDEIEHLADAALTCVPKGGLIVEIGSYAGLSTAALLYVARTKQAKVASCDMFMWNGVEAERHLRDVLCAFPDVHWRFYWTSSEIAHHVATTAPDTRGVTCPPFVDHNINLLHIDGDHLCVARDCELWLPHLVPGGMVAFHDANPDPRAEFGCLVVRDVNQFTGTWRTVHHSLSENCLLIRQKPE